jgi:hypothetical protein
MASTPSTQVANRVSTDGGRRAARLLVTVVAPARAGRRIGRFGLFGRFGSAGVLGSVDVRILATSTGTQSVGEVPDRRTFNRGTRSWRAGRSFGLPARRRAARMER